MSDKASLPRPNPERVTDRIEGLDALSADFVDAEERDEDSAPSERDSTATRDAGNEL